MRQIAASYIIPCCGNPVKNGVIRCKDDGTILEIRQQSEIQETESLEYYNGIIVPGFVNTHCHLELSHLKGIAAEGKGIGGFIGSINKNRNSSPEQVEPAVYKADQLMLKNGITAVGDISNTTASLEVKTKSKVYYHTFVESFGFLPSRAERAFSIAQSVYRDFCIYGLNAGITPHSPYSVSAELFTLINGFLADNKSIATIHFMESHGEIQFFTNGSGPIAEHMVNNLNLDISHWKTTGKSPGSRILEFIPDETSLLLVHNTFCRKTDIRLLFSQRKSTNTFFVLCPNSNLYIENTLPPVQMLRDEKLNICIGTDSLASNHNLSVLSELITLQENFPGIASVEMFSWACINGAKALGIDNVYGSFEPEKKPGINLISDVDLRNLRLTSKSNVKRLI